MVLWVLVASSCNSPPTRFLALLGSDLPLKGGGPELTAPLEGEVGPAKLGRVGGSRCEITNRVDPIGRRSRREDLLEPLVGGQGAFLVRRLLQDLLDDRVGVHALRRGGEVRQDA